MLPTNKKQTSFSTTLAKGMSVLESLDYQNSKMSNGEISARTGISRPTVARLTSTLLELGYLRKEKSKFRLSWRVLHLTNSLWHRLEQFQSASGAMKKIADEYGGAVSVGTVDQLKFMYLVTLRSQENIWGGPDVGTVGSLINTSIGQTLCSMMSKDGLNNIISKASSEEPEFWVTHKDNFYNGINHCKSKGYCHTKGALHPDIDAIAAPLTRDKHGDYFALNFRAPNYMITSDQLQNEIAPKIVALASAMRASISKTQIVA